MILTVCVSGDHWVFDSLSDRNCLEPLSLVMGNRLNFMIAHRLELVDEIDPDFANYNWFTHIHWLKYFLCPGRKFRSIWFLSYLCICPFVKGHINWFSYIHVTLCKTYCQCSRSSLSDTSLPCGFVVHINLIACFVQASDDRSLKMRIDHIIINSFFDWLINYFQLSVHHFLSLLYILL